MRLAIFVFSVLLLPPLGLYLGGREWGIPSSPADDPGIAAALHTSTMLLLYTLLLNHVTRRLTGSAPLDPIRFMRSAAAGALLGWMIGYLNLFAASWTQQTDQPWMLQLLLYTPLFALTAPATLATRDFFAAFPVLKNALCSLPPMPALNPAAAAMLGALATAGLAAGAAAPDRLAPLFWASPPLLLYALRWQRPAPGTGQTALAMLAGLVVGNFALASYQSSAAIALDLPITLTQPGYALFGILCMQVLEMTGPDNKTLEPI